MGTLPFALPPRTELVAVLSRSDRSIVAHVRRDGADLVARISEDASQLAFEVSLSSRLRDPCFLVPLEWGTTEEGRSYLLRRFEPGRPFDLAAREGSEQQVVGWVSSILGALAALHAAGLVHRDLKASNVIVGADGPRLVDLDLTARTDATVAAGSAFHVAPEVLVGQVHGQAADLFSLGVMLAVTFGGAPSPRFLDEFPSRSFWSASGLDRGRIPSALRGIVDALVRRHPSDRPAGARAAQAWLPGGEVVPRSVELPTFAGREDAFEDALASLAAACRVLLVGVEDPSETEDVARELKLGLAIEGMRAEVREVADALDGPLDGALDRGPATQHLIVRSDADTDARAVGELVRAHLAGGATMQRLILITPESGSAALEREAEGARERGALAVATVRRLDARTLERHLDQLSSGASPGVASRLALSLLDSTRGNVLEVNRRLRRAVADQVLRPSGTDYLLLRDEWPAGRRAEHEFLTAVGELSPSARRLLCGVSLLADEARLDRSAQVADLAEDDVLDAHAELLERGMLDTSLASNGRRSLTDPRLGTAALATLSKRDHRALRRRAAEVLRSTGADEETVARHVLESGPTEAELASLIDVAERARARGRLARARWLTESAVGRGESEGEAATRGAVLLARLELAQGQALSAVEALARRFGQELDDAPHEALLVAAEAAESAGQRARARELYERVLARTPSAEEQLTAITGLGYASLLDGGPLAALEATDGHPAEGDPDAPSARLSNLRAGALAQLGRFDEAEQCLDEAMRRARACGDPALVGLAELNRGFVERRRGRPSLAVQSLERALEAFDGTDSVKMRALVRNNTGVLYRDLGNLTRARELLEESLALRRRIGDAHGVATSRGSLALVRLEAGEVGAALDELAEARAALRRGGYVQELRQVDLHYVVALAIAGRFDSASDVLAASRVEGGSRSLLEVRAEATLAWAKGEHGRAVELVRGELPRQTEGAGPAESFRAAAFWSSLDGEDPESGRLLDDCANRLGPGVRRSEAQWRNSCGGDNLSSTELEQLLEDFSAAGRTDLVRVVADKLVHSYSRQVRVLERRRLAARREATADSVVGALPAQERSGVLERIDRLAGGAAQGPGPGLELDWFLSCNRRMAREADLEGLLTAIVDIALELTGARHGLIVLLEDGRTEVEVARSQRGEPMSTDDARFSRTIVRDAVESATPVVSANASDDDRFAEMASVRSLRLRSVLCVPLPGEERPSGGLYIDNDQRDALFDQFDVELVCALADQAAIAITNLRHRAQIETLNERLQERVAYQKSELDHARRILRSRGRVAPVGGLVGESSAMIELYRVVGRLAPTDLAVLVTGPSGSGKELVARALHERSLRANGPLVVENVAALPENLLESELFGHVRGAFSGATANHAGLFVEAHGGTFFMDEIGEMPIELQAKLLRVIESGELRPVGSSEARNIDVRIVAATNRDLRAMISAGKFREDLYYRLNAAEVRTPSLADRVDDIPLLVEHFLRRLNEKHQTSKVLHEDVLAALSRRAWPGEVRELSNEVSRIYFLSAESIDDPELVRLAGPEESLRGVMPASYELDDAERAAIQRALKAAENKKEHAARLLGISRAGLYTKLRRLGIGL